LGGELADAAGHADLIDLAGLELVGGGTDDHHLDPGSDSPYSTLATIALGARTRLIRIARNGVDPGVLGGRSERAARGLGTVAAKTTVGAAVDLVPARLTLLPFAGIFPAVDVGREALGRRLGVARAERKPSNLPGERREVETADRARRARTC